MDFRDGKNAKNLKILQSLTLNPLCAHNPHGGGGRHEFLLVTGVCISGAQNRDPPRAPGLSGELIGALAC